MDIFVAISETYDGGMGIYNSREEIGAYFNEAAARRAASAYVKKYEIKDAETLAAGAKPETLYIAVAQTQDGGYGVDSTDVGAYLGQSAAENAASRKSGSPYSGYARKLKILDAPPGA